MDLLPLLCVFSVALTGLTTGANVLPAGSLNALVGGKVMFNTAVTPPEKPFVTVVWTFINTTRITIISSTSEFNKTGPGYEGRITLYRSTGSLELRNLTLADIGEYRLIITTATAEQLEGSSGLDILVPVSNVTANTSSTDLVEFNSSAIISCFSSGSSLSFLWLNGSSEVTASDRVHVTDGNSTLTILNVTRYDSGPYSCRVSNALSEGTSDPVKLSISYGPDKVTLMLSPPGESHIVGSTIILNCSTVSSPSPQFKWFMNGDIMSDTGSKVTLENIQMNQSGSYSCQAFNSKTMRYETSQPSAINVLEEIVDASITPSTNQMIEEKPANLSCDGDGSVFTREWMKDGAALTLTENMTLFDRNRVLVFHFLKGTDSGNYSCNISNPIDHQEAKYTMVVIYGPENVKIQGPSEIHVKQSLTLNCSAASTPPASYTWILNGKAILNNSAIFTKTMTEVSDGGVYTCQALNKVTGRNSSKTHQLSVAQLNSPSCTAGCIAGIVIACLVVCVTVAVVAFYIWKKKKGTGQTSTRTGNGLDNTAFSRSQDLVYADIHFAKNKDGGAVRLAQENQKESEYAQIQVNSGRAAASSPPTYDAHMQRNKRQAPQPGSNGAHDHT